MFLVVKDGCLGVVEVCIVDRYVVVVCKFDNVLDIGDRGGDVGVVGYVVDDYVLVFEGYVFVDLELMVSFVYFC